MSTSAATFKAPELSYPFIISLSLSLSLWYILTSFPAFSKIVILGAKYSVIHYRPLGIGYSVSSYRF